MNNASKFLSRKFIVAVLGVVVLLVLALTDKATVENVSAITGLIAVYTGGQSYVDANNKGGG